MGDQESTNLVRFVCRAKEHVDAPRTATEPVGSPVTVHERAWAYCPAGARADHEWEAIEAVTLADLKLIAVNRPREAVPEPTPEDSRS